MLLRHVPADAPALITAINESLEHLRPWMAWAKEPADDASIEEFLAGAIAGWEEGREFGFVIRAPDSGPAGPVLGGCGLHRRGGPGVIEIGYWVHAGHTRRGIARALAIALRDQAFAMGFDRVEIRCDARNVASASVARSAGFRFEATVPRTPRPERATMIWFAEAAG